MIVKVGPDDLRLGDAAGSFLILAAIQGLAKTIGPGLRRELWLAAEDKHGEKAPLGAICRTENGILATVSGGEDAVREVASFLGMMGHFPATVDAGLAQLLPGDWRRFPVLRYDGGMPGEVPLCPLSVMALVDCNIAAGMVGPSAREELYAELHLRMRRGAAQLLLVPGEDGKPAAGACVLLGRDHAVIGYLACPPEKRRRGYGSAALSAAVRAAMGARRVPVLACGEELVPYYIRRGFSPAGEVYERRGTLESK